MGITDLQNGSEDGGILHGGTVPAADSKLPLALGDTWSQQQQQQQQNKTQSLRIVSCDAIEEPPKLRKKKNRLRYVENNRNDDPNF